MREREKERKREREKERKREREKERKREREKEMQGHLLILNYVGDRKIEYWIF